VTLGKAVENEVQNNIQKAKAKVELLDYLIGIAQETPGSELWRALFAEMRASLQQGVDDAQFESTSSQQFKVRMDGKQIGTLEI